jgi:hypothetical protein
MRQAIGISAIVITVVAAIVWSPDTADRLTRRARWLALAHRRPCDVDHAFASDGTIVAVCRDGTLQAFHGSLPCSGESLPCMLGVWPACYEAGHPIPVPPGLDDDELRSLMP